MPVEPSINDLSPVVKAGIEKEPILLLDTTGSMAWPAADGISTQRREIVGEAMGRLVTDLAAQDSQAAAEQAAGEDAGGLMTITFAGGEAKLLGDLSPMNWKQKWADIQWGGGTYIVPGWNEVLKNYMDEFADTPATDRPNLLCLVITDGEADDTDLFVKALGEAHGGTHVCVAIVGFGDEHDKALSSYQAVAAANDHVRVVTFGGETNPDTIAEGLISLLS